MREQGLARGGSFATDLYRGGLAPACWPRARSTRRSSASRAGVAGRPRGAGRPRDDAHLGRRRARERRLAHGVHRRRLGRDRPRHRHPAEQHARRVRPRPAGREGRPGLRMTSMMAPSLVLEGERPRLVVGSAGSLRLRGAIMQIVVNAVGHGLGVEEAITRAARPSRRGPPPLRGRRRPGRARRARARWATSSCAGAAPTSTSAARPRSSCSTDGTLAAAGDPRRGGHGVVVAA